MLDRRARGDNPVLFSSRLASGSGKGILLLDYLAEMICVRISLRRLFLAALLMGLGLGTLTWDCIFATTALGTGAACCPDCL